jgi:16S rRNA (cytosine1402-N4)-methyltransferase
VSAEGTHEPVMVAEVREALRPGPSDLVLDLTVGAGGHAAALLAGPGGPRRLIGADRDPAALARARSRLEPFGDRVTLVLGTSEEVVGMLDRLGAPRVSAALLDLGVSSCQLDDPGRGFGFRAEGPLDLRMDPSQGRPAARLLAEMDEERLSEVLQDLGEEREARRIARHIAATRGARPIATTKDLAERVVEALGPRALRRSRVHPATRVFQALRILVNDELGVLERTLPALLGRLESGGRVAVIAFHSLEDRIVKRAFRAGVAQGRLAHAVRTPARPTAGEIARNPRSRSARLRWAVAAGGEEHS